MTNKKEVRHGLLADLNFNLPYVSRSSKTSDCDATLIISLAGTTRKSTRYEIDFSPFFKQMNPNPELEWTPKNIAFGNDRNKNLFVVFDEASTLPNALSLAIYEDERSMRMQFKAGVLKALVVWGVQEPTAKDVTLKIKCVMAPIHGVDNAFSIKPLKLITDYGNGQPPKVSEWK